MVSTLLALDAQIADVEGVSPFVDTEGQAKVREEREDATEAL
jgi:hypothetical protein